MDSPNYEATSPTSVTVTFEASRPPNRFSNSQCAIRIRSDNLAHDYAQRAS